MSIISNKSHQSATIFGRKSVMRCFLFIYSALEYDTKRKPADIIPITSAANCVPQLTQQSNYFKKSRRLWFKISIKLSKIMYSLYFL